MKDEIESYKDVFQEKYKGKIITLDDARELVSWALASTKESTSTKSPRPTSRRPGRSSKAGFRSIGAYDSASPKDALLKGNVAIGVIWNGEGGYILRDDKSGKFKWILPEDGTPPLHRQPRYSEDSQASEECGAFHELHSAAGNQQDGHGMSSRI